MSDAKGNEQKWYTLTAEAVSEELQVDPAQGLSEAEAAKRLEQYGPNSLDQTEVEPTWRAFLRQYKDYMRIVLTIAAVASLLIGEYSTAILLFIITVFGWITFSEQLGLGIVAIAGAIAFLIAGLVRWEDVNSGVNWGVVLLYAAAISLGVQMKDTGAAEWVARNFVELLRPIGLATGAGLDAAIALLTTFVTNTMTAGAAIAVLGPIVLKTASAGGADPLVAGFIAAISSAFAYITAAAHPAFTIIYASGYLTGKDFLKSGWRMTIASLVVLMVFAFMYWPLLR